MGTVLLHHLDRCSSFRLHRHLGSVGGIAKILFFIFLVVFIVLLVLGIMAGEALF
jgi:hypothetical protein